MYIGALQYAHSPSLTSPESVSKMLAPCNKKKELSFTVGTCDTSELQGTPHSGKFSQGTNFSRSTTKT